MPSDGAPRTPRTANRVRFEFEEQRRRSGEDSANGDGEGREWEELEEEDYLSNSHVNTGRRGRGQRTPLLTDIEAPSVTLATSGDEGDWIASPGGEGVWEERPKSGMRAAFMNMANSIIGAGIIGQPYAFRQAGLATGVLLLVGLTITVDWTIRLIVVNSKLSGANSFQATMEHCFGRTGLIAISVSLFP
jgi:sodium-coupled neutral amino acid transporter 11